MLKFLLRNVYLVFMLAGLTMVASMGKVPANGRRPALVQEEFGVVDRFKASIYAAVVLNYKQAAPWAEVAGYDQPALVLERGLSERNKQNGFGQQFATAYMAETLARHDWQSRQSFSAVATANRDNFPPPPQIPANLMRGNNQVQAQNRQQMNEARQAMLRQNNAPQRKATEATPDDIANMQAALTALTGNTQEQQDIAPNLPPGTPFVSPFEAISNAAKSLNEVDAALKQAIAAGG